uniref:Cholinesterase n=1 Tax=Sinocyclocheilus anshuiensis TaxID=1608454 RepID=A0A671PG17_9TELE
MSLLAPALLVLEYIMLGIDIKTTLQILALLFLQLAAGQDELIVSTDKGKVRGLSLPLPGGSEYVAAFLGIPYAKPPLDQLHFRQPEAAEVWNGIRNATQYSNSCFQDPDTLYPGFPGAEMWNPNTRISEDCLYLNVWTPSTDLENRAKPLVPVMVWIYSGGFSTGTASLDVYYGHFLSHSQQVVVVFMNYRVGALGFLSLPESVSIKRNAGLFDQRLALSWVSRNIAAFGGDPSSVTLFGESVGAGSVGHHLLSQGSHGLFTRAILQSGSPNAVCCGSGASSGLESFLDSGSASELLACLRAVEPVKIVSLQFEVIPDPVIISVPFPPTLDGEFLADMPSALIQSGHFLKTELHLGLNRDEGTYFLVYGAPGFGIHNQSLINRDQFLAGVSLGLPGFSDIQGIYQRCTHISHKRATCLESHLKLM